MSFISKERSEQFWKLCIEYLESKTDISAIRAMSAIESKPPLQKMEEFYHHLLGSLKNRQGMPNAIGNIDRLESVLFAFDPKKVSEHYGDRWGELFDDIEKRVKPSSRMKKNIPQNYWVVFSKGALDGASFLSTFDSVEDFKGQVDQFAKSKTFCAGLPELISKEITGFGFPLACDFLKDAGWSQFGKPDVHTKRILKAVGLSNGKDFDTFKTMQAIALNVGETVFLVDKHIWHIGSGKLNKKRFASKKTRDKFIKSVVTKFKSSEAN